MRAALMAVFVTLLVWLPVLENGFVWDDFGVVLGKRSVQELDWVAMARLGLWEDVAAFSGSTPYYRPLVALSFGLDHALTGGAAWFAHAHSLAWNLTNVGLVAWLLRKSGGVVAVGVASLVGLHPSLVEATAFAAARNDLMVTTFSLLALIAAQRKMWFTVALCALLAMASKETGIILPILLMLLPGGGLRAALSAAVGAFGMVLMRTAVGISWPSMLEVPWDDAARIPLVWLGWLVWPGQVGAVVGEGSDLGRTMAAGALLAVGALVVAFWRPSRFFWPLTRTALVLACCLAPGLLGAAALGVYGPRYLYLPVFVGAIVVGGMVGRGFLARCTLAALVVVSAAATRHEIGEWASNDTLFLASTEAAPNARAWRLWGDERKRKGQVALALSAYDEAVQFSEGRERGCPAIADLLPVLPSAATERWVRWESAGCRTVEGFDDALLWAFAREQDWASAKLVVATQTIADDSGRSNAVRGAFRLADGDWAALMVAARRNPDGPSAYLDAAYGVHLSGE